MPEQQTEKQTFDLSGGLNTEISEVNWPDGFTSAEANYELLADGTRRRRKGLAVEASAGTAHTIDTMVQTQAHQTYVWKNVGGDPDKSFLVHQIGKILYFTDDDTIPSDSWHAKSVDTEAFGAETTVTAANVRDEHVRFSQGRGHLLVTGPYLRPFYVNWNTVTNEFDAVEILMQYRDFEGVDDGVDVSTEPDDDPIGDDHRYNLRNRGWKEAAMLQLLSTNAVSPAKNGLWFKAYERAETSGSTYDPEGLQSLDATSAARYDAEVFGNSTAPQGSLFLDPFDTRFARVLSGGALNLDIASFTLSPPATTLTVTTVANHSYSVSDSVTISGQLSEYEMQVPGPDTTGATWDYNGTYTVLTVPTATSFTITVSPPYNFLFWTDQNKQLGEIGTGLSGTGGALDKSDGSIVQRGFKAIGFYAGRVWYAGMADSQFADHVFFSRICQTPQAYGECHQRQDPTDETYNEITPADGGVLVVPGMNGIVDMMVVGNSLVLLGTEGAWEVTGQRGAIFTATAFGVKQLTAANFNSPTGSIPLEDGGMALGPSGIYIFGPNQFTGLLEAKNMIDKSIQTKWNGYSTAQQQRCQTVYDDARSRLYILIGATATDNRHTEMLVFDTKQSAWTVYTFTDQLAGATAFGLMSIVVISEADDSSLNQKIKCVYQASTTTVQVADFQQTDYLDFDGLESPLPFMVTGYDNVGDFQRRKQTPIITVFSRRTETGFVANGDDWDAVNPSSTLMTPFWDWTEGVQLNAGLTAQETWDATAGNHGVSGKIGVQSQVYRHTRGFVPLAAGDVDGYPVVVTRNKVRGRGRVLQLRFDGAATKDSHLIGWHTNYKVSAKK